MRHSPDNEYNYIGHFLQISCTFSIEEEDSRSVLHVTRTCMARLYLQLYNTSLLL